MEEKLVVGPRPIVWVAAAILVLAGATFGVRGMVVGLAAIILMGIVASVTMNAFDGHTGDEWKKHHGSM